MVEPCLRMFPFLKKTFLHFLCSMVCRYAWIQGFHYANICVITGVTFSGMREMILWWLNILIINFFEPMFVWVWLWTPFLFCSLFITPLCSNVLFHWSPFYVYYFLPVMSLFFKFCIFPQVLKICYSVRCILLYLEFSFSYFLGE